jgi:hypothetical protein
MKLHLHVGVIEAADAETLDQVLLLAECAGRVLARLSPTLAVLEREDAELLALVLNERGLHPMVMR